MARYADILERDGGVATNYSKITDAPSTATSIALAVSSTTDGMDFTVTVTDKDGGAVTVPVCLDLWFSDDAAGIGITADAFSGALTVGTGAIIAVVTAKKHLKVVTSAAGVLVGTIVDSANPTDVYVAVSSPNASGVAISVTSGTNWEGV